MSARNYPKSGFSIRLKKVATPVKQPPENFPFVVSILPFTIKWLQTEFLVLNFQKQSLHICLNYNNCFNDHFISDQNLPFAYLQVCSLSFTQKVLSEYVLRNSKSFFLAGNVWNIYWLMCDKIIPCSHFNQNLFINPKVNWKNSRRSQGVLSLILWVCLKAFKVYLAIHNRIPAGAPAEARSNWKHCKYSLIILLTMFLWKIYREFVKNFSGISTECTKQRTVTIHHNKTKLVVICQQGIQGLHKGKTHVNHYTIHLHTTYKM